MTDTTKILQVQTAIDGTIWVTRGNAHGSSLQSSDSRLLGKELSDSQYSQIRILGMGRNAACITALYQYAATLPTCVLMIASPDLCYTQEERDDPVVALNRMRQCLRSASLGGWHVATQHDFNTYALVDAVNNNSSDDQIVSLLLQHPAWHDLSFIKTLDKVATAKLLAMIIDPRWYINLEHPTRLSKLKMFLGLTPTNIQHVRSATAVAAARVKRCALVLQAWGGSGETPTEFELQQPENFIWRRVNAKNGELRGLLCGCSTFISYCVYTWQHQIANAVGKQQIEFFLPDAMFDDIERNAYIQHNANR